jgi:V/A-type H+-transporting ATPase subunit E
MSLETVVEDIRQEARARAEEIRAEADARAEEIVEAAETEAEEIVETAEREVEREIQREREQRLSSATLEAKQRRLEARRDVLETVREEVETALVELSGERREALTRELLEAAASEFEGADAVSVYARAEDRELVESLLAAHDGFTYVGEYDCLGGVVVESEASRVRINNTFDSVLETVWEDQLKDVSARLFDQ